MWLYFVGRQRLAWFQYRECHSISMHSILLLARYAVSVIPKEENKGTTTTKTKKDIVILSIIFWETTKSVNLARVFWSWFVLINRDYGWSTDCSLRIQSLVQSNSFRSQCNIEQSKYHTSRCLTFRFFQGNFFKLDSTICKVVALRFKHCYLTWYQRDHIDERF